MANIYNEFFTLQGDKLTIKSQMLKELLTNNTVKIAAMPADNNRTSAPGEQKMMHRETGGANLSLSQFKPREEGTNMIVTISDAQKENFRKVLRQRNILLKDSIDAYDASGIEQELHIANHKQMFNEICRLFKTLGVASEGKSKKIDPVMDTNYSVDQRSEQRSVVTYASVNKKQQPNYMKETESSKNRKMLKFIQDAPKTATYASKSTVESQPNYMKDTESSKNRNKPKQ